jgi:hypothetical protein
MSHNDTPVMRFFYDNKTPEVSRPKLQGRLQKLFFGCLPKLIEFLQANFLCNALPQMPFFVYN